MYVRFCAKKTGRLRPSQIGLRDAGAERGQGRLRKALGAQVLAEFLVGAPERVRVSTGFRTMKSREAAVRLKRFEADEKARKVAELEHMIREFEGMASDLDRQVKAEEERTGVKDPAHFAYSTFARSAGQRRDNLHSSVVGLMAKLEAAQRERDDALEQLSLADAPATREELRTRRRAERSASATLR